MDWSSKWLGNLVAGVDAAADPTDEDYALVSVGNSSHDDGFELMEDVVEGSCGSESVNDAQKPATGHVPAAEAGAADHVLAAAAAAAASVHAPAAPTEEPASGPKRASTPEGVVYVLMDADNHLIGYVPSEDMDSFSRLHPEMVTGRIEACHRLVEPRVTVAATVTAPNTLNNIASPVSPSRTPAPPSRTPALPLLPSPSRSTVASTFNEWLASKSSPSGGRTAMSKVTPSAMTARMNGGSSKSVLKTLLHTTPGIKHAPSNNRGAPAAAAAATWDPMA